MIFVLLLIGKRSQAGKWQGDQNHPLRNASASEMLKIKIRQTEREITLSFSLPKGIFSQMK